MEGNNVIAVYRQVTYSYSFRDPERVPLAINEPPKRNSCYLLTIVMLYCIGILAVVYGAIYIDDCPADKRIPLCLIALGGVLLLKRLLNCTHDFQMIFNADNVQQPPGCLLFLDFLCFLAILGLFITLCCLNFGLNPETDPDKHDLPNYCHTFVYTATYWGCVAGLIVYSFFFCCTCCVLCAAA